MCKSMFFKRGHSLGSVPHFQAEIKEADRGKYPLFAATFVFGRKTGHCAYVHEYTK